LEILLRVVIKLPLCAFGCEETRTELNVDQQSYRWVI